MLTSAVLQRPLFGLFEVDTTGTVLYSRIEADGAKTSMVGQNFYDEFATFENAEEFRHRIGSFTRSRGQADCFNFDFQMQQGLLPVKVLVARLCERTNGERTRSILIHIRKI